MTANKLPTKVKYQLFQRALAREDYLEANRWRENKDPELRKLITPDEQMRVIEGIRKGFESRRYDYI